MNKRGFSSESVWSVYRTILVAVIAFIVLGLSFFAYDYYVEVRDIEAGILIRQVVDCVAPEGVLDMRDFVEYEDKLLDYCGFNSDDRVFVEVSVFEKVPGGGEAVAGYHLSELEKIGQGDSGALWVVELYEEEERVEDIKKYAPGHLPLEDYGTYLVGLVQKDGKKTDGVIQVEVLVGHEF